MSESMFLTVEVDDGTFTEPLQLLFRRTGPIVQVRSVDDGTGPRRARSLQRRADGTLDAAAPAWACPVEDSGAGVSWLVYGGNAGLWLAPEGVAQPDLGDSRQVVEAYVLVDRADLELA
jgi:hypothetical protein